MAQTELEVEIFSNQQVQEVSEVEIFSNQDLLQFSKRLLIAINACFFADIDIFADGVFYYICRKKQLSRTGWRCKCLAVFLKFCPRPIKVLGQNLIKNKEKRGKCLVI